MAEEEGKGVEDVQKPMEFEGMDFGQAQFQAGFGQPVDPDQVVPLMGDMPVPGEINGGTALDFGQAPTVEGIDIPKRPDDLQFGDRSGEVPTSELLTGTPVCLIPECEECPLHPGGAEQTSSPGGSDQPSGLDPNAKPFAILDPTAKPFDPVLKPTLDPNSPPFQPTAPIFNPDVPSFDPSAKPFDPNVAPFDPLVPFLDPNAPIFDPTAKPFDPTAQPFMPEELVPDLSPEKQASEEVPFGKLDAAGVIHEEKEKGDGKKRKKKRKKRKSEGDGGISSDSPSTPEHPKPPLGAEEPVVPSDVAELEGAEAMKVNGEGVEKHEIEVTEKEDVNDVVKEIITQSKRQEEVAALMSQPKVEDVGPDDIQAEIVDTPPEEAEEGQQQAFLSEQATIEALLGARQEPEDLIEDVSQVTGSEEVSTPGEADLEDSMQDAEITETSDFEFVPGEEMEEEEVPKSPRQDDGNAGAASVPEVQEHKEGHGDLPPSEEPMLVQGMEEKESMEVTEALPSGEQPVEEIGITGQNQQIQPPLYDPFNELAEQDPLIEEGLPPELTRGFEQEPAAETGPPPSGFQDADFFSDLAVREPEAEMPQEVPSSQGVSSEVGPPPQEGPWGEPVAAAAPTGDIWGFDMQGVADKVETDTPRTPEASTWDRDFQQHSMQSFAFSEQERQLQGWDAVFPGDNPPLEPSVAPHQAPILEEGANVADVAGEPQPFDAVFPPDEAPAVPIADIRVPTIPEEGESTPEDTPTGSEPSQPEQQAEESVPTTTPDSSTSDIPAIMVSEVPKVETDDEFLVSVETVSTGDIETVAMEAEVQEAAPNDITDEQIVAPPDVIADQVQVEEARQAEQVAQMAAMAAQQKWMEDVDQVVMETGKLEHEVEKIATDTAKAAEMVEEAMENVVDEGTRVEVTQVATEVLERAEDKAGAMEDVAEEKVPEPEAMQVEAAVAVEPVEKEEVKEEAPKAEAVAEAKPPEEPKAEEKVKKAKPAAGAAAKAKTTDKAAPKTKLPGKTGAAKPAGKDVTKRPTPPSSVSKEAPPAKKKIGAVGATKTSKAAEPTKKPSAVSEPKTKKPTRSATAPSARPTSTAATRAAKPASAPAKTTKAPPSGAVPKTKTDRKPGAARPKPSTKAAATGSSAEEQASVDSVEVAVDAAAALGDQVTPKPSAAAAKKPAEKKAAIPQRTARPKPASAAAPKAEPKTAAKKPAGTLGTRTAAAKTGTAAARPASATAAKKPDATTRLASARAPAADKKPAAAAAKRPASAATTPAARKTATGAASTSATRLAAAKKTGTTGAAGKPDAKTTPRAQSAAAAKSAAEKKTAATPARARSAPLAGAAAKAAPKAGAKAPATPGLKARPKAPATPTAKDAVMKNKVKTPSGKGAPTPGRTPGRGMQPFAEYISREAVAEGLKKGDFIKGALRINARNFEDAYVPAPDGMSDLYIPGIHARNRALNGDIVVLKVLPRSEWRVLQQEYEQFKNLKASATSEGASPVTQLTEGMKQLALHTPEPPGAQAAVDTTAGPQSPLTEGSGDAASSSGTAGSPMETSSSKSSEKEAGEKNDRKKKAPAGKEKSPAAKTPAKGAAGKGAAARTATRTPERAGRSKPGEQTTPKGRQPPKPGSANKTPKAAEKPGIDPTTVPEQFLQKTAKVVYIYEKKHSRACTGHLKKLDDKDKEKVLFSPIDHRLPRLKVPLEDCPAGFKERPEDHAKFLFIARITDWKENSGFAEARLAKSLGEAGQIEPETEGLLVENGVDFSEFSEVILQCLPQDLPWSIPAEEFENRRDLRLDCIFTIDPATARDLDDAVSCNKLDDGTYEVGVHIADVSYFIQENTALDLTAACRATSVYLVQKVIPMLPRLLCEQLCSLNPDEERLAFSVIWKLTETGDVLDEWFGRTIIRSCAKLSYDHAQTIIDNPDQLPTQEQLPAISDGHSIPEVAERVLNLYKISQNLRKKRFDGGALRLDQPKLAFSLDPASGLPNGCSVYQIRDSNRLIEEFMLLANMAVAHKIHDSFPERAVLRRHPPPQPKMVEDLVKTCATMGINLDISSSGALHQSIARYIGDDVETQATFYILTAMASKPMQLAKYFCSGCVPEEGMYRHYALNVPLYTHFTSPIRRYADVLVHRLLGASLGCGPNVEKSAEELQGMTDHCNDRKDASKRVQEASADMFFACFVKECGPLEEDGMVMGVLDQAVDVLVWRLGVVKRAYCNAIPLKSYDFEKVNGRPQLTLTWAEDPEHPEPTTQVLTYFSRVQVTLKTNDQPLKYSAVLKRP
ncbi:DIS3L2 [Branchiostoma lanceolatum]|uniref:DIS3-like exonuclease 2 n=1 Tax=Branchiostoma lanceolatum TaxID=7740 RepID=A0A8J9W5B2_BRALA|nr:DIS3L2 [Branchiostoma lanceolatum]